MHDNWLYNIKPNEEVELNVCYVTIKENLITILRFKKNVYLDIEEAQELVEQLTHLINNQPFYLLAVPGKYFDISIEAKQFFLNSEIIKMRKARALVTNKLGVRLIANFISKLSGSDRPTKLFDNENDAEEWLIEIINTHYNNKLATSNSNKPIDF